MAFRKQGISGTQSKRAAWHGLSEGSGYQARVEESRFPIGTASLVAPPNLDSAVIRLGADRRWIVQSELAQASTTDGRVNGSVQVSAPGVFPIAALPSVRALIADRTASCPASTPPARWQRASTPSGWAGVARQSEPERCRRDQPPACHFAPVELTSPRVLILPPREPIRSLPADGARWAAFGRRPAGGLCAVADRAEGRSAGSNRATGLPCLVITMPSGSSSSRIDKHRFLNLAAVTFFTDTVLHAGQKCCSKSRPGRSRWLRVADGVEVHGGRSLRLRPWCDGGVVGAEGAV
jgi:hypothetical protein